MGGGLCPPTKLLAQPPSSAKWGGRLKEGIRERGKWWEGAPPQPFQTTFSTGVKFTESTYIDEISRDTTVDNSNRDGTHGDTEADTHT